MAMVLAIVDQQIHRPEDEGGFGPDFSAAHIPQRRRTRCQADESSVSPGPDRYTSGDVTAIDAIADSIDVDASFEAEVGLQWEDNPSGGQIEAVHDRRTGRRSLARLISPSFPDSSRWASSAASSRCGDGGCRGIAQKIV
jgi:hypothetical protein